MSEDFAWKPAIGVKPKVLKFNSLSQQKKALGVSAF